MNRLQTIERLRANEKQLQRYAIKFDEHANDPQFNKQGQAYYRGKHDAYVIAREIIISVIEALEEDLNG